FPRSCPPTETRRSMSTNPPSPRPDPPVSRPRRFVQTLTGWIRRIWAGPARNCISWPERFTGWVTRWVGSVWAFTLAFLILVVWAATGPMYHYSDPWQLVINTGTSVVTFLMVFLIQRSQNKDPLAMQLKLNEILAALKGASNRLIDVEDLS